MKFKQLDQITELVPGEFIVAKRTLRADEDYLRDHFPLFPVMPGVLMLEALFQAACWLIRVTDDYECSLLTLQEAKNVKFADFVEPGQTLEIKVEILKNEADRASLKGVGMKGDVTAVSARLVVAKSSLSATRPDLVDLDRFVAKNPRTLIDKLMAKS
ncbi:MAG: beta-hydroxyacyl-ACP dehydratase [Planctomycetota bacterium]|nr:beta-hydroxyacyl-ACP dehydratase [Planctomycetota bacterium]